MQFSDTSSLTGIVEGIDFLCGTNSTSFALKDKARLVNERQRIIWTWIHEAYGGWIYDDSNKTDLPQATNDLTSGTSKYALPSAALTVQRVEVMDSAGNWNRLKPYEMESDPEALGYKQTGSGVPNSYRLVGTTVELFPNPNYSSTGGLKVFYDRDGVDFVSTDTTATPGFAVTFHNALVVGATIDWAIKQGMKDLKDDCELEWLKYEKSIRKFYSERWSDKGRPRISPKIESYF